jgi:hypothetical protein
MEIRRENLLKLCEMVNIGKNLSKEEMKEKLLILGIQVGKDHDSILNDYFLNIGKEKRQLARALEK